MCSFDIERFMHSSFSGHCPIYSENKAKNDYNKYCENQTPCNCSSVYNSTEAYKCKNLLNYISFCNFLYKASEIFMYFSGSNTSSWKGLSVEPGLKVSRRNGLSWWCGLAANRQPDWECRYLSVHAKEEGKPWGAPWGSSVSRRPSGLRKTIN